MELLLKTKFDLMDRFPNEFIYSIATLLMDVFDNQLDLESEYDRKFIRYLISIIIKLLIFLSFYCYHVQIFCDIQIMSDRSKL